MGFFDSLNPWSEERKKKKELENKWKKEFLVFVEKCRPDVPDAPKHPKAALYRYVWRRCVILEQMKLESKDLYSANRYNYFGNLSANIYYNYAPENAYGKVKLEMSPKQAEKIAEKEISRLTPRGPSAKSKITACVYLGIDTKNKRPYVGQTIGDPENRWKQHRTEGTGPFSKGASFVDWKILKECNPSMLDYWESYYIGKFNAVNKGYNRNIGNSPKAYREGESKR